MFNNQGLDVAALCTVSCTKNPFRRQRRGCGGIMTARYLVGDVLDVLPTLEAGSVDLVMTSPPFLALRSYLPADHPDKSKEGGSQPTPGAFIDWLVDVVEALDRVLAPHGSMVIELGDTYAGSSMDGGDQQRLARGETIQSTAWSGTQPIQKRGEVPTFKRAGSGWPADKSLTLIPELFRMTLVYGFNPLTGRTTKRWRLRNVIRWVRPNPPVGALGDKFRPATSELMVFCRTDEAGRKRYFDLDAVREVNNADRMDEKAMKNRAALEAGRGEQLRMANARGDGDWHPAGAPPLDWWEIPPGGYQGAHYAVFPEALCVKPIKAMSPEKVCRTCGEPSRRIVDVERTTDGNWDRPNQLLGRASAISGGPFASNGESKRSTVGWSDCGHNDFGPGMGLDPFAGSGTTLAVAVGHGRDAIGIDLDERNADLARERIGMFLEVTS